MELNDITKILSDVKLNLTAKNDLARIISEIEEIEIEQEYLERWLYDHPDINVQENVKKSMSADKLVELQAYLGILSEDYLSFRNKIDLLLHYKIFRNEKYNDLEYRENIIFALQYKYYEKFLKDKKQEKSKLETIISKANVNAAIEDLRVESMKYFNQYLCKNLPNLSPDYTTKNYRGKFSDFMAHFPIIGSSTHSLVNSIVDGYMLDYVIIDEASQQDIVPGILCLGCARNVIVVGDTKQLSHIPETTNLLCPEDFYNCQKYSLLDSVNLVFGDKIPRTLLKEHYRCHPKIIQFCNKQFYNNQLIPMKEDDGSNPLSLITTSRGNHMRDYENLREIESLLETYNEPVFVKNNIGFIAPYNKQVNLARKHLDNSITKDTIHKFQGRECDEIVFSTVLDKKAISQRQIDFVDNAELVNVAVSRAKNKFTLVTGNNVFTKNNKHIAALIRYIKYYGDEDDIIDSPVISAFDLLYAEHDESLEKLKAKLKKKDSKYKSEQIIAAILRELFIQDEYNSLTFHMQIYLKQLVSMKHNSLTEAEKNFIKHNASCDFVLYYHVGKNPLMVIEVDGGRHRDPHQMERDQLKNSILEKAKIPLLRLPTNGSKEEEKITKFIRDCLSNTKDEGKYM